MKNLLFACLLLLVPFLASAQNKTTRTVASFNKIAVSGGFDKVYLKEGGAESVEIEASSASLDDIVTEVKDNTLVIKTKKGAKEYQKATITINYRAIKEFANSGSSDIETLNAIKAEKFELASSGSGAFKGEFDVAKLEVAISGSSDMTLKGKASEQEIALSGSADVNASALSGDKAEVAISGSGDVKLGVKGKIKTAVSGSGTVTND